MSLISGYECVTRRGRSFSLRLSWEWTLPSDLRLYRTAWSYSSASCSFPWWRRSRLLWIPFSRALPATPPMGGTLFLPWTPLRAAFLIREILNYLRWNRTLLWGKAQISVVWGMFTCMLLWFGQGHLVEGFFSNEAIPLPPRNLKLMHDIANIYQNVQWRAKLAWFFFLLCS